MKRATLCCWVLGAMLVAAIACGCSRKQDSSPAAPPIVESFASPSASLSPPPAEIWKEFSGDKAFAHVRRQVELGPRPSGSSVLETARKYITDAVEQAGWEVTRQKFVDITPRGPVTFVNLIARFKGEAKGVVPADTQRVILGSHYDTKIFDTIRFVGADDGASSTGALMELARVLALDPAMARRIELVFFDGEEAVAEFSEIDGLYGSRYYAHVLRESGRNKQFKFGLVWDMIGPADLNITLPTDSPPEMARGIFGAADVLGVRKNFSYFRGSLLDDHKPLNDSHIPTIDLIDFDFLYWHTADDTLDKLSADSLSKVGQVTLYYLRHASLE